MLVGRISDDFPFAGSDAELEEIVKCIICASDASGVAVLRAFLSLRGVVGYSYQSRRIDSSEEVASYVEGVKKRFFVFVGDTLDTSPRLPTDFYEVERVHQYCASQRGNFKDVRCFVNDEAEVTVLLWNTEEMRCSDIHWLPSIFLACIPYYFKENTLSESERRLLDILSHSNDSANFEELRQAMLVIFDESGIKQKIIKNSLNSLSAARYDSEIARLENDIRDLDERIVDFATRLSSYDSAKLAKCAELCGLKQAKIDSDSESSLSDFIEAMKDSVMIDNITNLDDGSKSVSVWIRSTLENWDEDAADRYIGNNGCFLYEYAPTPRYVSKNGMRKLLRSIFIDRTLKIRVCARYTFSTSGGYEGVGAANTPSWADGYVQNPHIYYHSCLGNYRPMMRDALVKGDYETLINVFIASCSSLNIVEEPTMRPFVVYMYSTTDKFIELPDGRVVSPAEAVKFLNNGEEENVNGEEN